MALLKTASFTVCTVALLGFFVACGDGDGSDNPGSGGAAGAGSGSGGASAGSGGSKSSGGSSGKAGSGSGGGSGSGNPSVDAFWNDFAEAVCHRYWHCPSEDDEFEARVRLKAVAGEEARCVDLARSTILARPHIALVNRAVAAGQLVMQQAWVDRCLAMAAACNYPTDTDPDPGTIQIEDVAGCREVFEGTVALGADCDMSEQCAGDAMCVPDSLGECGGACTSLFDEGEACVVDRQCAAPPDAWPVCSDGQCEVRDVGAPSGEGMLCLTSSGYPLCATDLWCPGSTCYPPVALGEMCDPSLTELSQCIDGFCDDSEMCSAYTVRTSAGGACDDTGLPGSGTELCDSFASLVCDGGECVTTDRSPGSPCHTAYWFDAALCPPEALLPDGADCTTADQCESGICRTTCAATLCGT